MLAGHQQVTNNFVSSWASAASEVNINLALGNDDKGPGGPDSGSDSEYQDEAHRVMHELSELQKIQ